MYGFDHVIFFHYNCVFSGCIVLGVKQLQFLIKIFSQRWSATDKCNKNGGLWWTDIHPKSRMVTDGQRARVRAQKRLILQNARESWQQDRPNHWLRIFHHVQRSTRLAVSGSVKTDNSFTLYLYYNNMLHTFKFKINKFQIVFIHIYGLSFAKQFKFIIKHR